jgi:long-chain acyl-CoA synthetase
MERIVTYIYLYNGCSIGYAESLESLLENLGEIKPHFMVLPPRVFEKIYSGVMDNVLSSSSLKQKIFFWALEVGKKYGQKNLLHQSVSPGLKFRRKLAHKLVFSKIVAKTGGRIRFFVSGGAALSRDIAEFFYALGMVVLEAYGLTETSPVISVTTLEKLKFGTVGKPIPGIEVRIAEDGEILTKGPHVMKGYYKKDVETEEVLEGGWFHTGDIGHLDDEGFLVITDRKKDLIVTSGGKNVAPQQIENLLKTNPYISNAVVTGDKRKFISALIIPNFEKIEEYAKSSGIPFEDKSELLKEEKIIDFMLAEIDKSTSSLARYEKVKKIALLDREFELGDIEVTPTLKVKRNIIEEKYKDLIDSLYED